MVGGYSHGSQRSLLLLHADEIQPRDPERLTGPSAESAPDVFRTAETFEGFKEQSERLFLQQRLLANDWNVKRTAESLGMQRSNLYKKIERYGLK